MNESAVSRPDASVALQLNGDDIRTSARTIVELLVEQGLDPERPGIAVALNDAVIVRSGWGGQAIADGDSVEIITAMQGG